MMTTFSLGIVAFGVVQSSWWICGRVIADAKFGAACAADIEIW